MWTTWYSYSSLFWYRSHVVAAASFFGKLPDFALADQIVPLSTTDILDISQQDLRFVCKKLMYIQSATYQGHAFT